MYASLPCSRLLVGVDSSPLAALIPDYLPRIQREFAAAVTVLLAAGAAVDPDAIAATGAEVIAADHTGPEPARQAAAGAELFVVVPATATLLAKLAAGVADDSLSQAALASPQPLVIAAAMTDQQWYGEPVAGHVRTLRAAGHYLIESGRTFPPDPADADTAKLATVGTLLLHLWHVQMRRLRQAYWPQATATAPRTPAATKPVLVPIEQVTMRPANQLP